MFEIKRPIKPRGEMKREKGERVKCDFCKSRNATFHYTNQQPSKTFTLNLCSDCVKKHGADDPRQLSEDDLWRLLELKYGKDSP